MTETHTLSLPDVDLVYDVHGQPMQLLHGLYRPDRYEYQMEVSQFGALDARIAAKEIF